MRKALTNQLFQVTHVQRAVNISLGHLWELLQMIRFDTKINYTGLSGLSSHCPPSLFDLSLTLIQLSFPINPAKISHLAFSFATIKITLGFVLPFLSVEHWWNQARARLDYLPQRISQATQAGSWVTLSFSPNDQEAVGLDINWKQFFRSHCMERIAV